MSYEEAVRDADAIRQAIIALRSEFADLRVTYTHNPGGTFFYLRNGGGFQISDFPDWEDVAKMRAWLESERSKA